MLSKRRYNVIGVPPQALFSPTLTIILQLPIRSWRLFGISSTCSRGRYSTAPRHGGYCTSTDIPAQALSWVAGCILLLSQDSHRSYFPLRCSTTDIAGETSSIEQLYWLVKGLLSNISCAGNWHYRSQNALLLESVDRRDLLGKSVMSEHIQKRRQSPDMTAPNSACRETWRNNKRMQSIPRYRHDTSPTDNTR